MRPDATVAHGHPEALHAFSCRRDAPRASSWQLQEMLQAGMPFRSRLRRGWVVAARESSLALLETRKSVSTDRRDNFVDAAACKDRIGKTS